MHMNMTVCFAGTVQIQVNAIVSFTYIKFANECGISDPLWISFVDKLNVKFNVLTAVLVPLPVDAYSVNCSISRSRNK